jgi:hypothetical protein
MAPLLFPALATASWVEVDLDALARRDFPDGDNPLNDAVICTTWVCELAKGLGVDFTLGGFMEDRSHLWRGHYHDPAVMRHLGVDYNVPEGTEVVAPVACMVERVLREKGVWGGWGGFVVLRLHEPVAEGAFLMLGHLDHVALPEPGRVLAAGDVLARVGGPAENGGWYPHLHAQLVTDRAWTQHDGRMEEMDGYGLNWVERDPLVINPRHVCG